MPLLCIVSFVDVWFFGCSGEAFITYQMIGSTDSSKEA